MVTIELNELAKAKELIDLANSVALEDVVWTRDGEIVVLIASLLDSWKYVGLTNAYFAYMHLLEEKGEGE